MSVRINWTTESRRTFDKNLEYLSEEWNNIVMNNFLDRVEAVFNKIKSNPRSYILHRPEENIYKCVVHKRIVLYYKIVNEEVVDLLTFWNTYMDPNNLKM